MSKAHHPDRRTSPNKSLPDRIRHLRRRSNLTQAALAKLLGVAPSAVAQWESPTGTSPTVDNLLKLAVAGEVSFEWLATGRGPVLVDAHEACVLVPSSFAADHIEERLLLAFRRIGTRKREPFVRCMEEVF